MGIKISEMTPAESLANDDLFEISQKTGGYETKCISAKGIKDYIKNSSNGGFHDAQFISASGIDSVTYKDVGVYWCSEPYTIDRYAMTGAIVEVITYTDNSTGASVVPFIERFTFGANTYQRFFDSTGWTQWVELSNHSSTRIDFGSASLSSGNTAVINFNKRFDTMPIVIATVNYGINDQMTNTMAIPFVLNTTLTGFTLGCWVSNVTTQSANTIVTEDTTVTEGSSSTVTHTTQETTQTSNINWTLGAMTIDWVAMCDDMLLRNNVNNAG